MELLAIAARSSRASGRREASTSARRTAVSSERMKRRSSVRPHPGATAQRRKVTRNADELIREARGFDSIE